MLTRGLTSSEFTQKMEFWLSGPTFAAQDPADWPAENLGCLSDEGKLMAMCTVARPAETPSVIPVDKYSDIIKLFRVTGLVMQFIAKLKLKAKTKLDCYNEAKLYHIKREQTVHFGEEINFLENPSGKKPPSLVNNFRLFLDNKGIVCSQGRLENCSYFDFETKNPILLPKNSVLTTLLMDDVHKRCQHLGVGTTLTSLRKMGYWIPKSRIVVKSALSKCVTCQKINSLAFRYPVTNDYITDKVNFISPYQHTAIDFTGNVWIKLGDKLSKMYLLVFTCLNIRSIHLELLPDLTCKNFLLAFVRFSNLYRMPSAVYSDNASTFLQALGILAESSIDNAFQDHLIKNNIRHNKIPLLG